MSAHRSSDCLFDSRPPDYLHKYSVRRICFVASVMIESIMVGCDVLETDDVRPAVYADLEDKD